MQPHALRAQELYGDFWFNSEPLPLSALRGQVILLEIWDYTCVSSLRAMPYVKAWDHKYHDHGLIVIGVHTPKFPFARDPEVVQKEIRRLGISFPVVMDNQQFIAAQYGNRVWPTAYLIDKNGFVRLQSEGEGSYDVLERSIQTLLHDARGGETLPTLMEPMRDEDRPGAACYRSTQEIYTGYLRGSIGNVEGYSPESVVEYADPKV
jgi:thiol-disulfide isomerase/thioredoxin